MAASLVACLNILVAVCTTASAIAIAQFGAWSDLGIGLVGSAGTPSLEATRARYGRMPNLQADNVVPMSLSVCVIRAANAFDYFGISIATCDHNLDGLSDQVIGASQDLLLGTIPTGAVNVLLASGSNVVTSVGDELLSFSGLGLGTATYGMGFGVALTSGRFSGSCDDRLAIGIPSAEVSGVVTGSIAVVGGGLPAVAWSQGQ